MINTTGLGPFFKSVAFLSLCYLTIANKLKVPVFIFALYGIGSAFCLFNLLNIKKDVKDKDLKMNAGIYEQVINIGASVGMIASLL